MKTETLAEGRAVIKVKQADRYWNAQGKVISDDGMTVFKRGVVHNTREQAIQWVIFSFGIVLAAFTGFEEAKEILRGIEDSIQPELF